MEAQRADPMAAQGNALGCESNHPASPNGAALKIRQMPSGQAGPPTSGLYTETLVPRALPRAGIALALWAEFLHAMLQ